MNRSELTGEEMVGLMQWHRSQAAEWPTHAGSTLAPRPEADDGGESEREEIDTMILKEISYHLRRARELRLDIDGSARRQR